VALLLYQFNWSRYPFTDPSRSLRFAQGKAKGKAQNTRPTPLTPPGVFLIIHIHGTPVKHTSLKFQGILKGLISCPTLRRDASLPLCGSRCFGPWPQHDMAEGVLQRARPHQHVILPAPVSCRPPAPLATAKEQPSSAARSAPGHCSRLCQTGRIPARAGRTPG
jgi:hypothetical protein